MGGISLADARERLNEAKKMNASGKTPAREVVLNVYRWAIERGQKVENPAEMVPPTTIVKFVPRDRSLTPAEMDLMYMNRIGTSPQYRAAIKLLPLTLVRKSELSNTVWDEIIFSEALWTIPKERMKRRNPH